MEGVEEGGGFGEVGRLGGGRENKAAWGNEDKADRGESKAVRGV